MKKRILKIAGLAAAFTLLGTPLSAAATTLPEREASSCSDAVATAAESVPEGGSLDYTCSPGGFLGTVHDSAGTKIATEEIALAPTKSDAESSRELGYSTNNDDWIYATP